MMEKIQTYLRTIFQDKKPYFLIGNLDENIAKRFLTDGIGIGFNTFCAYALRSEYDVGDIDGKWAVDVSKMIKRFYGASLSELNQGLDNPEFFHRWAFCNLINRIVLEEVCHTAGYTHENENEESYGDEIFKALVAEFYESPEEFQTTKSLFYKSTNCLE